MSEFTDRVKTRFTGSRSRKEDSEPECWQGLNPMQTRREFLRNATLLGISLTAASEFLVACGSQPEATSIPATSTPLIPTRIPTRAAIATGAPPPTDPPPPPTGEPPASSEVRSPQPIEITAQLIADGLANIGGEGFDPGTQVSLPATPEAVEPTQASASDLVGAANSSWYLKGEDQIVFDQTLPESPIKGLKYILSLANRAEITNQPVSFAESLSALKDDQDNHLAIPRVALKVPEQTVIEGALPPGFVLKPNSNMLVVGQYGDRVMVAIEENAGRTVDSPQTPRLFMVSLPHAQFEQLVSQSGAEIDGGQIRFNQDTTAPINKIEEGLAEELEAESAVYFADTDPEGVLYENPLVPYPDEDIEYKEVITQEGKVVAVNEEGSEVATAVYEEEDNMWEWQKPKSIEEIFEGLKDEESYRNGISQYLEVMRVPEENLALTVSEENGRYFVIAIPQLTSLSPLQQKYSTIFQPTKLFEITNTADGWRINSTTPRELAEANSVQIGTMLTGWHVKDPNHMGQKYMALPKRHFTTVVSPDIAWRTGIEGGKYDLRPTPDKHNYFIPNQVRGYAEQGDMNLQFNSVLWGNESTIPEWVKNINSADQFWSVVELHIEKLLTQYRGSAESYSLLNEYLGNPFKDESKYKFWKVKANELGISDVDFVKRVFTKAKSVDPSAVLVYNEYGIEIPGSSTFSVEKEQQTYNLLENAITAGAPIDAVGFQMHLYARDFKNDKFNPTVERFRQQVRRYKELGIQVRLTELDIRLNEGLNDLSLEEKLMLQASIYHRITQVALEEGVESIVVWGVTDRETWLEKPENGLPNASEADPLLFDNEDIPKPAYYALLSSLS